MIEGYNAWNMDAILAPRAPNCTHRVYPNRLGRPTMNNTEYEAYFSAFLPYFANFRVTVLDAYVDEEANQVALQAASTATSAIGPYANEYVLLIKMTESKTHVYEIREFVDSEASANFFPNLTGYIANGGPGLYGDIPKGWRGLDWDKNASRV
ncbi:hypothetical protein ACEQ8H_005012 [Pleosporales sp. CAS-2024a]